MTELEIRRAVRRLVLNSLDSGAYSYADLDTINEYCRQQVVEVEAGVKAPEKPHLTNREALARLDDRVLSLEGRFNGLHCDADDHRIMLETANAKIERLESLIRSANTNIERLEVWQEKMADCHDRHTHPPHEPIISAGFFFFPRDKAPRR